MVFSDINESLGLIEYGVLDEVATACVRANLVRLNIPEAAADIRLTDPIRLLDD